MPRQMSLHQTTMTKKEPVSARDWRAVLEPVVVRYQGRNIPRYFRADAAFAQPERRELFRAILERIGRLRLATAMSG